MSRIITLIAAEVRASFWPTKEGIVHFKISKIKGLKRCHQSRICCRELPALSKKDMEDLKAQEVKRGNRIQIRKNRLWVTIERRASP
jgi:hypothetical protein